LSTSIRGLRIVHTEASLGWGGQETRILAEAAGMSARGHDVVLLCPAEARIYDEARLRGVPVLALPIDRKNLRGLCAMHRWLKINRADVINTHSSTDSWLVALASLFLTHPPPMVRTRHISATVPKNAPTRWLYGKASRHIVTTGESLRRKLIDENKLSPEMITSVPTGIDPEVFVPGDKNTARSSLGLPVDVPVIGIVATLRSWKGHSYLLEAIARLGRDDVRLVIVGDGPGRPYLQRQIEELGLQNRVTMAGNQRDVLPWLQSLDIFVLPSYANEGVPQAVIQAMLCRLPVITTNVGSIPELATPMQTALIVEPRRSDALAETIAHLLDDPNLRDRLGRAAQSFVARKFGLTTMLDKMEKIFLQVAGERVSQR